MKSDNQAPPSAEFANLPLSALRLDPANPRFASIMAVQENEPPRRPENRPVRSESEEVGPTPINDVDNRDQAQLDYLMSQSNLPDLMRSIASQGFFPGEPILVVRDDEQGDFLVIEGNRRVAACVLLDNPGRAPRQMRKTASAIAAGATHRPNMIPSLIFEQEVDIHRYLGYRHISGVQEWSPLAKASYLRRQYLELSRSSRSHEDVLRLVGDRIGTSSTYAARLMTSLALYERAAERYFYQLDLDPRRLSFSLITLAISRRSINQYLGLRSSKDFDLSGLREDAFKHLLDWMFVAAPGDSTVLGDSRNIGKLAEVLDGNVEALEVLIDRRDLEEAWLTTQVEGNEVDELLIAARECLEDVGSLLDRDSRNLTREEADQVLGFLRQANDLISRPPIESRQARSDED